MILDWEIPLDISKVASVDIGTSEDVSLGFSEITSENSESMIVGSDINGHQIFRIGDYDIIDPEDYCVVRGRVILPFRTKAAIERIDLYDETLSNSKEIYTNSIGQFVFIGVPGEIMKVKIAKENFYTYMVVPDTISINFDDVDGLYGYRLDLNQHAI